MFSVVFSFSFRLVAAVQSPQRQDKFSALSTRFGMK